MDKAAPLLARIVVILARKEPPVRGAAGERC
jgi:hypothetical protein